MCTQGEVCKGRAACVGDNGEDWRGEMAGKEEGMRVRWPIWSNIGAISSPFTTLGSGIMLSVLMYHHMFTAQTVWRDCAFFGFNWSGSAIRPKEKHILLFLLTPQCTKDHNIATVECTSDQYN